MNINYNSEECYDVRFNYYDEDDEEDEDDLSIVPSDATIERRNAKFIEKILSLKTTDFQNKKPGTFFICNNIDWNHAILRAFFDVLYYFKERGIQWAQFILEFYASAQPFTSVLLQTVNGLNIFKRMNLVLLFDDDDEYLADREYLFPGIIQNKQLESLHVWIGGHDSDRFEYDFTAFASHLREMTALKELELKYMFYFNEQSFCESLSENKSLEKLHLDFEYCYDIGDEGISNIVNSLSSHPKLEDLYIRVDENFGDLSSKAFKRLLSKTQTLPKLEISKSRDGRCLNTECILQGLKKNRTLQSLKTFISLYGDLVVLRFFQILLHCPKLEYLKLNEDSITKRDLEQVIHMDRLQRPIILKIRNLDENISVMTKLLRCHPEVRLQVDARYDCLTGKTIQRDIDFEHICKFNWYGRYMVDRSTGVPLSLWPLVFENINKSEDCNDKPSIIYEFLKGPALAARNDS